MSPASLSSLPAVRALLAGAIDYAGLFPPAGLQLASAVDNFIGYRASEDGWALGRLVVSVARLAELEGVLAGIPAPKPLVAISALIGADTAGDVAAITRFNLRQGGSGPRIDAIEVKSPNPGNARAALAAIPPRWNRYLEVSLERDPGETLDVIAEAGAFAKIRTGGTTPDAFPPADLLAAFIREAAHRKVPFKATAGLHHPIRGAYRLTYAKDAPVGTMYGYLNILLAAAIVWGGGDDSHAEEALLETDSSAIWINGDAIVWRHGRFPSRTIVEMRSRFFHGFGSCSFTEPMAELTLGPDR